MSKFVDDPTAVIKMVQEFRTMYDTPPRMAGLGRMRLDFDISTESPLVAEKSSPEEERPKTKRARLDTILEDADRESTQLSPWQIRLKEKELIETKAQVCILQIKRRNLETAQKELRLELEDERESGKRELRSCHEKIEDLESRLRGANERELRYVPAREHCVTCTSLEKKLMNVEKTKMLLENEWKEKELTWHEKNRKSELHLSRVNGELAIMKDELQVERNVTEEQKKIRLQSAEVAKENEDLKTKLADMEREVKTLQFELDQAAIRGRLAHLQESRLAQCPQLEKENVVLREKNKVLSESIDKLGLYEEQIRDFNAKLKRAEGLQTRVSILEAQEKDLLMKLREWQNVMKEVSVSSETKVSPRLVLDHVRKLQMSELTLTSQVRDLESELKAVQRQLAVLEEKFKTTKQEATDQKQEIVRQMDLIRRLKKKLYLVSKERDAYRELVDQYEKDLTISATDIQSSTLKDRSQTHIEALERNLQNYRDLAKNYENALETASPLKFKNKKPKEVGTEAEDPLLKEQIEHLKLENERLLREKEVLEIQLEHRALKGDYNPLETQVFHFKKNPAAVAISEHQGEVERLREENLKLKERVNILQEAGPQEDLTQQVLVNLQKPGSIKEVADLREQNHKLEVRMERLKDASRKMSQDIKDSVFNLFGYRLLRTSPGTYRLSSMYAENDSDYLLFQVQGDNQMTLLETPYIASLDELIDLHLHHQRSIPVFLSSITIDLFSKRSYASSETITID